MNYKDKIIYWLKNIERKETITCETITNKIIMLKNMGISIKDCNAFKGFVDLHIHSLNSDGTFEAKDIIFAAYFLGLSVISITDHCSIDYALYDQVFNKLNMIIIPGLEVNAEYKGESVHVLLYGEELKNKKVKLLLNQYMLKWNTRMYDMLSLLRLKYKINLDDNLFNGNIRSIDVFDLCKMIEDKYPQYGNANDILEKMFGNKSEGTDSAYINSKKNYKYLPNVLEVISDFNQMGVRSVLAHNKCVGNVEKDIEVFKNKGLKGLEYYHPQLSKSDREHVLKIAQEYQLILTGGSDWHGYKKNHKLGIADVDCTLKIPFSLFAKEYLGIKAVISPTNKLDESLLTLEEKVGLLIRPGFNIFAFDIYAINNMRKSNDTYGKANKSVICSPEDLKEFVQANINASDIPIVINVNQEGGRLNTIEFYRNHLVCGNWTLGKCYDKRISSEIIESIADEISSYGIRWNLAPVCDILTSENAVLGTRSFGDNIQTVNNSVKKYIEILQGKGIAATAKHFPGNGQALKNGHDELSIVYDYSSVHLEPFKTAIKENVAVIMISDGIYDIYDSKYPALMSRTIITDLLRNNLNYKGLIMTDNITMPALLEKYTIEEIAVASINAGADIVMYDPDFAKSKGVDSLDNRINKFQENRNRVYNSILNAVRQGIISEQRLNDSVKRIIHFINKYGITKNDSLNDLFDYTKRIALNNEISKDTISFYDKYNVLPLDCQKKAFIIIYTHRDKVHADSEWKYQISVKETLGKNNINVDEYIIYNDDVAHDWRFIKEQSVIFISYNLEEEEKQVKLIQQILAINSNLIVIGVGTSREEKLVKKIGVNTYINVCMRTPYALEQAFKAIWRRK